MCIFMWTAFQRQTALPIFHSGNHDWKAASHLRETVFPVSRRELFPEIDGIYVCRYNDSGNKIFGEDMQTTTGMN